MEWWIWFIIAASLVAAAGIAALVYWNNAVRTVRYEYVSEKLPSAFDGLKIAHISDLHNKYYGSGARRLAEKVAREHPDIIVISGDMIQSDRRKNALALAAALVPTAPVYYVSGNHESYVKEYPQFLKELSVLGVKALEDETVFLRRGDESIALSGAIDPRFYMERGKEREEEFARRVRPLAAEGMFNLLVSHRPEYMAAYVSAGFDLVLSGHTHAGQVRFPFIGAIFTSGERFRPKYVEGRYDEGETTMIISGGLGSSSAVPRVLNRPQLLFEVLKKG